MKYMIIALGDGESTLYPSDEKEYEKMKYQQCVIWKQTVVKEYVTPEEDDRLEPYTVAIMQKINKVAVASQQPYALQSA